MRRYLQCRGIAQIISFGFERQSQYPDGFAFDDLECLLEFLNSDMPLPPVDVHRRLEKSWLVVVFVCNINQRRHVFAKTGSTPPDSRVEKTRSDAPVEPEAANDLLDV